jgi:hypothetical protein
VPSELAPKALARKKNLEQAGKEIGLSPSAIHNQLFTARFFIGTNYGFQRGYIESLAKQINAAYENNIFDGRAVLMRRLEEVLLILSYENLGIAAAIRDPTSGTFYILERIVTDAVGNSTLNLSRNSRKSIETFRELGNYSAHKITYICRREYIKEKIDEYRALIDELLHKSGIRT